MRVALPSHPTRVRGLKLVPKKKTDAVTVVAPHAGAWIETLRDFERICPHYVSHPTRVRGLKHELFDNFIGIFRVAPHAGAWIETCVLLGQTKRVASHPTRVRGLKHGCCPGRLQPDELVAPHAGAWIETGSLRKRRISSGSSPPSRVRD